MYKRQANYRYADAVRSNIGYALDQQKQQERHKAFVENAKKHNIPIPKKKKEPWEAWPTIKQQSSAAQTRVAGLLFYAVFGQEVNLKSGV